MGIDCKFCTCRNVSCPLHPTRHDKGCAPCVAKNLKRRELPSCFFDSLGGAEERQGDSYADFARLVLAGERPGPSDQECGDGSAGCSSARTR